MLSLYSLTCCGSSVEFSRRHVSPDLTGRLLWLRQLFCLWPKSSWSIPDKKTLDNWPDCLFGTLNSDLTLPSSLCLFSSSCLLKNNLELILKANHLPPLCSSVLEPSLNLKLAAMIRSHHLTKIPHCMCYKISYLGFCDAQSLSHPCSRLPAQVFLWRDG